MDQQTSIRTLKAELVRLGITQREIALMLKVSPVSVNNVISGRRTTPRIRKAISLAIGKPISEIWPDQQSATKEAA